MEDDYPSHPIRPLTPRPHNTTDVEPIDNVRPCGGIDHCITASGHKAKRPHKKCEST